MRLGSFCQNRAPSTGASECPMVRLPEPRAWDKQDIRRQRALPEAWNLRFVGGPGASSSAVDTALGVPHKPALPTGACLREGPASRWRGSVPSGKGGGL